MANDNNSGFWSWKKILTKYTNSFSQVIWNTHTRCLSSKSSLHSFFTSMLQNNYPCFLCSEKFPSRDHLEHVLVRTTISLLFHWRIALGSLLKASEWASKCIYTKRNSHNLSDYAHLHWLVCPHLHCWKHALSEDQKPQSDKHRSSKRKTKLLWLPNNYKSHHFSAYYLYIQREIVKYCI